MLGSLPLLFIAQKRGRISSLEKLEKHPQVRAYLDAFEKDPRTLQHVPEKFAVGEHRPADVKRFVRSARGEAIIPLVTHVVSRDRVNVRDHGCRDVPSGQERYGCAHHDIDLFTRDAVIQFHHPTASRQEKVMEWSGYFLQVLDGDEDGLTKDLFAYAAAIFVHHMLVEKE